MSEPGSQGWSAYERLVMGKLASLEHDMGVIDEKVTMLRIDVAQLKVKAGVWGAVAGTIPALVTSLVAFQAGAF